MIIGFSLLIFATSCLAGALTIHMASRFGLGGDETDGVQKFHSHWVPRLGGIPIVLAACCGFVLACCTVNLEAALTVKLLSCSLPAFGVGLLEDVTRKAGVGVRLLITMLAAALGFFLLDAKLIRLDLPLIDTLLAASPLFAMALTMIAAAGVAHAVNIIDGYNGLSGFFVLIVMCALSFVAYRVGDSSIAWFALVLAAAVAGFLYWNFPYGKIFMGDAGAYLLGFLIAELSMMLVFRNPGVSPWFPLVLMIYPVWETLFSMYRRASHGFAHMGQPDALHLHQLIYRRLVKRYGRNADAHSRLMRNSFTSMYLWVLAILCAIPAALFYDQTSVLMLFAALFAISYVALYKRIIQFSIPKFMVLRARQLAPEQVTEPPPNIEQR